MAAENLIRAAPAAVVNASTSFTGRYPHVGPLLIAEAGHPADRRRRPGRPRSVDEGSSELRLVGSDLWRGDELLAAGHRQDATDSPSRRSILARADMGDELEAFAVNTLRVHPPGGASHLRAARSARRCAATSAAATPWSWCGATTTAATCKALRPYIREFQPVLVAVDGGADALLEVGLRPDVIIGDFDSVSEEALACGADLVHHVHPDGRAPGRENLLGFGRAPTSEFVAEGTSEDVAMLLAAEAGAELIVAVGTHASMVEFLDKGRAGMASTFLTRLRLGPLLVDAKGVNRLYETRLRRRDLGMLIGAGVRSPCWWSPSSRSPSTSSWTACGW